MKLDANTKLEDLIREYPALKTGMADINPKFKMLQTPMGKIMAKRATIADMSERSGMSIEDLVAAISEKIGAEVSSEASGEESAAGKSGAFETSGEEGAADQFEATANAEAAESAAVAVKNTAADSTADAATDVFANPDADADTEATATAAADAEPQVAWWSKHEEFKVIDVRNAKGNFFPGLKKRAELTPVGEGLQIVQSFEPIPLYDVMAELGYEHETQRGDGGEYHVYFYRTEQGADSGEIAFRPIALLNFPIIDEELGDVAVNFWNLTWNDEKRYLSQETRLLLSMANALGAGRMRQASRELIKAYAHGIDSRAFDDVFELVAWNQGIGNFASEIGPSTLFRAYRTIKEQERKGKSRAEIVALLKEEFGEKNPDVGVQ